MFLHDDSNHVLLWDAQRRSREYKEESVPFMC